MSSTNIHLSRRTILSGAAVSGASAMLAGCGDDPAPGPTADVDPLNALLRAEFGAIVAYEAGAMVLADRVANPMGDPLAGFASTLLRVAGKWKEHHQAHAAALQAAIRANNGTPVLASTVTFTPPSGFTQTVRSVLVLACNAEKHAAVAYNDSVQSLATTDSRFLVGNIGGDETMHFVVLYSLLKQVATVNVAALLAQGDAAIDTIASRPFVANSAAGLSLEGLAPFTYSAT